MNSYGIDGNGDDEPVPPEFIHEQALLHKAEEIGHLGDTISGWCDSLESSIEAGDWSDAQHNHSILGELVRDLEAAMIDISCALDNIEMEDDS